MRRAPAAAASTTPANAPTIRASASHARHRRRSSARKHIHPAANAIPPRPQALPSIGPRFPARRKGGEHHGRGGTCRTRPTARAPWRVTAEMSTLCAWRAEPALLMVGGARGGCGLVRVVLFLVAYELRTRWRGWAVLVLLVALAGGAVLTAAAGARRTSSAYPRFLRASHASDLLVAPAGTGLGGYDLALARLRGVRRIAPVVGLNVEPVGPGGRLNLAAVTEAPLDGRFGRQLDIPQDPRRQAAPAGPARRGRRHPARRGQPACARGQPPACGSLVRREPARIGTRGCAAAQAHAAGGRHHRHPVVSGPGDRHRQGAVHPGQPRAVAPPRRRVPGLRRSLAGTAPWDQRRDGGQ